MPQVLIAIKPRTDTKDAVLILDNRSTDLLFHELKQDDIFTISMPSKVKRYCQGWYNIELHRNYPCETNSVVDLKFDSCYQCRTKTDFNPAFYNSNQISSKQSAYNTKPHSVYVAYFGNDLFKAGIQSDSRGLDRLFEQGALYYAVVAKTQDAYSAHEIEARLISYGLRNSVTKNQKQGSYETLFRLDDLLSRQTLKEKLQELSLDANITVHSNLDAYFFGERPEEIITTIEADAISGKIKGIIGNYLVVKNHDRMFGFWLSKLCGYDVVLTHLLADVAADPLQSSLF